VLLVLALTACDPGAQDPTVRAPSAFPTATAAVPTPSGSSSAATRARVLQELARFDAVNRRTAADSPKGGGRAFIDGLVAAGYRRSDMQVTRDSTTIGLPAPSVQFSVLWHGSCLIGQRGEGSDGYRSVAVEPVDGRCLIGSTRAIDW
jgi:hypothetical protein